MMGPYPINRALGYDKAYIPEIDVEAIYRKLKKYARSHGEKERMSSIPKEKRSGKSFKKNYKELSDFWIRIKNWKKQKKLS